MTVSQGTLEISDDSNLGNSTATLSIGGATLRIDNNVSMNRDVKLTGTATFDVEGGTTFVQGGVSGTGTFIKTGTGRIRFFGGALNTFTGTVENLAGQMLTNFSHLTGNIDNEGELQLSQTGTGTYSQVISGAGTLIFGGGIVTLTGSNTFSGPTFINDTNVSVSADKNLGSPNNPITLNDNATVLQITSPFNSTRAFTVGAGVSPTIQTNSGTSSFTGAITGTGTLIKAGAGALNVTNIRTSGLTINQGTLAIVKGGGMLGTSQVSTLTFGGTVASPVGVFDLNDSKLAIDYPAAGPSPIDSVRQEIKSAYAGGSWNGAGLTSSAAAASTTHKTALGYAEATSVGAATSFGGVSTDSTTVVLAYTLAGDSNLDGKVNVTDFNALAGSFNKTGKIWSNGDFNYDGLVNAQDFDALAANYGQTISIAPALGTLVPEPASISCLILSALLARRRSKNGSSPV